MCSFLQNRDETQTGLELKKMFYKYINQMIKAFTKIFSLLIFLGGGGGVGGFKPKVTLHLNVLFTFPIKFCIFSLDESYSGLIILNFG